MIGSCAGLRGEQLSSAGHDGGFGGFEEIVPARSKAAATSNTEYPCFSFPVVKFARLQDPYPVESS